MIHIRLCLQAFWMIWSLKSIRIISRLRLWVKAANLYSCFISFTDSGNERRQLRSAMIAAVLSAIYDYETDWQQTEDAHRSLFHQLLQQYVTDAATQQTAFNLFLADVRGTISHEGLERGSVALRFYHALIGSTWLGQYSDQQIDEYGCQLQIIDDLIDLKDDQRAGHTNCFLTAGKMGYLREAQHFMASSFFQHLEHRTPVYSLIKLRCQCICNEMVGEQPPVIDLIRSFRPLTMVYAVAAAVLGFRLATFEWLPALLGAASFAAVTGSIMAFNDLVDREHDTKKNKLFAWRHTWILGRWWALLTGLICIILAVTALQNVSMAVYIGTVWMVGLAYSARPVRRWCILQPMMVAACSVSPLFLGSIYHQLLTFPVLMTAATFASIIIMREVVKDIQDQDCDTGYKTTIPVHFGHPVAVLLLMVLSFLPAGLLALHPLMAVRLTGYGLAAVQACNGLALLNPSRARLIKSSIDGLMTAIITIAMFAT